MIGWLTAGVKQQGLCNFSTAAEAIVKIDLDEEEWVNNSSD